MPEICQKTLPVMPWMEERTRRLPGLNPIAPGEWLQIDDAYGPQMAVREDLISRRRNDVFRQADGAHDAVAELLERILAELRAKPGFDVADHCVTCPDGRRVGLDDDTALIIAARLVQEDLLILQKPDIEHVLTAAVLCFPASWTLAEKFGGTLSVIHNPVVPYDPAMAQRVQRMFDLMRPETPMWRANSLLYDDPMLFQPRPENDPREIRLDGPLWVRVERQSLVKLAQTGAVVFSIHSYVVPLSRLPRRAAELLLQEKRG